MHFPEPMSAFDMVTAEAAYCALGAANTRVHCLPTTLGIDHRIINGRVYIGGNAVTDPGRNRAPHGGVPEARLLLLRELGIAVRAVEAEDAEADRGREGDCRIPYLPEFEPLEHVHAGRGIASNHDLLVTYQKTIEGYFRMWHHHFEFLLLGYGAYLTFFGFCKTGVSGDHGPDDRADGGGNRCGDIPARRRTAAPRTLRRRARSRCALPGGRLGRRHHALAARIGRAGPPLARGTADLARSLVQHQRRRRVLSLSPQLE